MNEKTNREENFFIPTGLKLPDGLSNYFRCLLRNCPVAFFDLKIADSGFLITIDRLHYSWNAGGNASHRYS